MLVLLQESVKAIVQHHLRTMALQLLPMDDNQRKQMENTVLSKQYSIAVIKAVRLVLKLKEFEDDFLTFLPKTESPVELFELMNYLNIEMPFTSCVEDIETYFMKVHEEEKSINYTKVGYYFFLNKVVLTPNMIKNIESNFFISWWDIFDDYKTSKCHIKKLLPDVIFKAGREIDKSWLAMDFGMLLYGTESSYEK